MKEVVGMCDGTFTAAQASSQTHDVGGHTQFVAHVNVSAISGTTPSATFVLEDSADGTNWANVATSGAVTATGTIALRSGTTPVGRYVRVRLSAFTGTTPSITTTGKGAAK